MYTEINGKELSSKGECRPMPIRVDGKRSNGYWIGQKSHKFLNECTLCGSTVTEKMPESVRQDPPQARQIGRQSHTTSTGIPRRFMPSHLQRADESNDHGPEGAIFIGTITRNK